MLRAPRLPDASVLDRCRHPAVRDPGVGRASLPATTAGEPLAPSTVGVLHAVVSSIFRSAVRDRKIIARTRAREPGCPSRRRRVIPLDHGAGRGVRDELPANCGAWSRSPPGPGMRQGEVFGLTGIGSSCCAATPRRRRSPAADPTGGRTGSAHSRPGRAIAPSRCPRSSSTPSTRTWRLTRSGDDGLVFTLAGAPDHATGVRSRLAPGRGGRRAERCHGPGMHALRHYYASLLIRYGECVKTVQARLGHASAAETLDTYSHLWPDSDDRTREAIDSVLDGATPGEGRSPPRRLKHCGAWRRYVASRVYAQAAPSLRPRPHEARPQFPDAMGLQQCHSGVVVPRLRNSFYPDRTFSTQFRLCVRRSGAEKDLALGVEDSRTDIQGRYTAVRNPRGTCGARRRLGEHRHHVVVEARARSCVRYAMASIEDGFFLRFHRHRPVQRPEL